MFDQLWNMACLHGDQLPQAISQKIKKVQNQGLRLITGSLRSTPIAAMESVTGL